DGIRDKLVTGVQTCALPICLVSSLPLMPEWYLLMPVLTATSMLALLWRALAVAVPLLVVAVAISVIQAGVNGARTRFVSGDRSRSEERRGGKERWRGGWEEG